MWGSDISIYFTGKVMLTVGDSGSRYEICFSTKEDSPDFPNTAGLVSTNDRVSSSSPPVTIALSLNLPNSLRLGTNRLSGDSQFCKLGYYWQGYRMVRELASCSFKRLKWHPVVSSTVAMNIYTKTTLTLSLCSTTALGCKSRTEEGMRLG